MGKVIEWLRAVLHAGKHKAQAESRYKEVSLLRRELIEVKMERDYWKQRFECLQAMKTQGVVRAE